MKIEEMEDCENVHCKRRKKKEERRKKKEERRKKKEERIK